MTRWGSRGIPPAHEKKCQRKHQNYPETLKAVVFLAKDKSNWCPKRVVFILSVNIKPKYLKSYAQNDVKNAISKTCPRIGPTMSTHPAKDTSVLGEFM